LRLELFEERTLPASAQRLINAVPDVSLGKLLDSGKGAQLAPALFPRIDAFSIRAGERRKPAAQAK
jgi:hypothetical protein